MAQDPSSSSPSSSPSPSAGRRPSHLVLGSTFGSSTDSVPLLNSSAIEVKVKLENVADCRLIAQEDFQALHRGLKTIEDNSQRLASLNEAKIPYLFSSDQLLVLVGMTPSLKTKLAMILAIAPRLTDPKLKLDEFLKIFPYVDEQHQVEEIFKARIQTLSLAIFRASSSSEVASAGGPGSPLGRGGRGGRGGGGRGLSRPASSRTVKAPPEPAATHLDDPVALNSESVMIGIAGSGASVSNVENHTKVDVSSNNAQLGYPLVVGVPVSVTAPAPAPAHVPVHTLTTTRRVSFAAGLPPPVIEMPAATKSPDRATLVSSNSLTESPAKSYQTVAKRHVPQTVDNKPLNATATPVGSPAVQIETSRSDNNNGNSNSKIGSGNESSSNGSPKVEERRPSVLAIRQAAIVKLRINKFKQSRVDSKAKIIHDDTKHQLDTGLTSVEPIPESYDEEVDMDDRSEAVEANNAVCVASDDNQSTPTPVDVSSNAPHSSPIPQPSQPIPAPIFTTHAVVVGQVPQRGLVRSWSRHTKVSVRPGFLMIENPVSASLKLSKQET